MTSRPYTAASILAVLAIVLVALGAYAGGYFWLGEWHSIPNLDDERPAGIRLYRHPWLRDVFAPAARIESMLGHAEVSANAVEGNEQKR